MPSDSRGIIPVELSRSAVLRGDGNFSPVFVIDKTTVTYPLKSGKGIGRIKGIIRNIFASLPTMQKGKEFDG